MRILVVGLPFSSHLARFVDLLRDLDWDVHVVAATDRWWHADMDCCTIQHVSALVAPPAATPTRRVVVHPLPVHPLPVQSADPRRDRAEAIARLIDDLRPDVVHSLEFQHSAYLTLLARQFCAQPFPAWIVSSWGSDLYFYGRDDQHRRVIREVLRVADGYGSDCSRDIALARAEGFRGLAMPVVPTVGGYELAEGRALRVSGPTSARTAIAIKGYQHRFGRALTAIAALDMCGDLLRGRKLLLHAPTDSGIEEAARRLADSHQAKLVVLNDVPNRDIIRMYGRSRVAIGLSISDGIPSSFLEALLGGAFPVQSFTACATEWVVDGVGAILVDPTDVTSIAGAIRRALTDDKLVDAAQVLNDSTIDIRLDRDAIRAVVAEGYRRIAATHALSDAMDVAL